MVNKTVLILTQGRFGGTDFLLARLSAWLKINHYCVEVLTPDQAPKLKEYDILFLPTSEMSRLWFFSASFVKFKHTCIWCMGYAAFRGAYLSITDEEYYQRVGSNGFRAKAIDALRVRSQRTLAVLLQHHSVAFTDEVGAYADIGELSVSQKIEEVICPIVIDRGPPTYFKYSAPSEILRVGWVGRVDMDFKFHALARVIHDIRSLHEGVLKCYSKIVFYIVGSGDAIDALKELISWDVSMEYRLIPSVDKEALSDFIRENIDLMFAMGTSSLESAKNKVPTIVVPPRAQKNDALIPAYRWISESVGYSLGELSYAGVKPLQKSSSLDVLLEQFVCNANEISSAAYEYSKFFDAEPVFKKLVDVSKRSSSSHLIFIKSFELFVINKLKKIIKHFTGRAS